MDDALATFLRDKAAQLLEISERLEAGAGAPAVPLDGLVQLARELDRKADELDGTGGRSRRRRRPRD